MSNRQTNREVLDKFVSETRAAHGHLRSDWRTVFSRPLSNEDWLDSAVLSGVRLSEILAGHVSDADIDPQVLEAFHRQYPNIENFTEFVRENAGSDELRGIIAGVKGKLFELEHVKWLNDDHLPPGYSAAIAESPTQPGYDIVIQGPHGDGLDVLQAKATTSADYVREAFEQYPNIDVVVPRETFEALSGDQFSAELIEGGISHELLESKVRAATDLITNPLVEYQIPKIALGFIAVHTLVSYTSGRMTLREALAHAGGRASRTMVASGAGWLATLLSSEPTVGLAISVLVRLGVARVDVTRAFANVTRIRIDRIHALDRLLSGGSEERRHLRVRALASRIGSP